jgi:hypothetical protein
MADQRADLYDFLCRVRQRPGMFVPGWSLRMLELICHGYSVALLTHGITEFGTQFNQKFGDFLLRRYDWSTCSGWAKAIRRNCDSDEEAFRRFFELLEQYRASCG